MGTRAEASSRRSYKQYCAIAYGLDRIGERWTLLIVRELLLGPKRYKDLLAALPGIGTNLLAARLRELEAQSLVERSVLPPPAGSAVYQLTEVGQELQPVLSAISRWASRFIGDEPRDDEAVLPSAYLNVLRRAFRPESAAGVDVAYEMRIGDQVFGVHVQGETCSIGEGRPNDPDVVMTADARTLFALLWGRLGAAEAVASQGVRIDGPPDALERFIEMFARG